MASGMGHFRPLTASVQALVEAADIGCDRFDNRYSTSKTPTIKSVSLEETCTDRGGTIKFWVD